MKISASDFHSLNNALNRNSVQHEIRGSLTIGTCSPNVAHNNYSMLRRFTFSKAGRRIVPARFNLNVAFDMPKSKPSAANKPVNNHFTPKHGLARAHTERKDRPTVGSGSLDS